MVVVTWQTIILKKDEYPFQRQLKDEVWAEISNYPSDRVILVNELKDGKTIVEILNKIIDKYKYFLENNINEVWNKETIENKLGRKLEESDYATGEKDWSKWDKKIHSLIEGNVEAEKLERDINNLVMELKKGLGVMLNELV